MNGAKRSAGALLAWLWFCAMSGPTPASASPATLQRSAQNLLFAPFDLALAPFVATGAALQNLRRTEDPLAVRGLFFLPGVAWNTGIQGFASGVRAIAGVLELPPGLALLFSERDLPPLFDPAERSPAWIDLEARWLRMRIGVDYTVLAEES